MFEFRKYSVMTDGEIDVWVSQEMPGNVALGRAPSCTFAIALHGQRRQIGGLNLRIGNDEILCKYFGHIGYGIDEPYRGNHYAAKACLLIKQVAKDYQMRELWITCNPDNIASMRTCEILGCELIDEVDVPPYLELYQRGERRKLRYLWRI